MKEEFIDFFTSPLDCSLKNSRPTIKRKTEFHARYGILFERDELCE